jgi:hypothetical protein
MPMETRAEAGKGAGKATVPVRARASRRFSPKSFDGTGAGVLSKVVSFSCSAGGS